MRPIITILSVTALILIGFSLNAGEAPKWKVELKKPVENYNFLKDGKYLYFHNEKYCWLYDAESGQEVWKMEIKNFEKNGIQELVGEKFLVSVKKGVECYDALTGNRLWKNEFKGIKQGKFSDLMYFGKQAVLCYKKVHIGVDLSAGKELWRTEIKYKGELVDLGTFNYFTLESLGKFIVLMDGNKLGLFDVNTGEMLLEAQDYKPHKKLIKEEFPWKYESPDEKFVTLVLENGAAVIDVEQNKEMARVKFDIDDKFNVLLPTVAGCAVLGKDQLVHFNFNTRQTAKLNFPLKHLRTLKTYRIGDKDVLILSLKNQIAAIDVAAGKVLWQTPKDDNTYKGYIHRYVKQDGNNIIFTYNRGKMIGSDRGTYLYLMSIDALSGKLNYKTTVALARDVITGFQRSMAKVVGKMAMGFSTLASGGAISQDETADMISEMFGYGNIGFEYNVFEFKDNIVVNPVTKAKMLNPETRSGDGEGFCVVNTSTGEIVSQDYFKIAQGMNPEKIVELTKPLVEGNVCYVPGDKRLIALDLAAGKRRWSIEGTIKFVDALVVINELLYVKMGKQMFDAGMEKDKVKINKGWKEDPYGFAAIDPASGKVLWRVETKTDPALFTPQFSITSYSSKDGNRLYFADEENIYALNLGRKGGQFTWTYNFAKNNVGKMDYEKTYAVKKQWIGSKRKTTSSATPIGGGYALTTTSTTGGLHKGKTAEFIEDAVRADYANTYESWGNIYGVSARRCLRVLFDGNRILVFAPRGIALINIADGRPFWTQKWKYNNEKVQFIPQMFGERIVYCVDKKLTMLDLSSGKEFWQVEEDDKSQFFPSPNRSFLFSIDEKRVSGYQID